MHVFLSIRLIEMLFVSMLENLSFAHVFSWVIGLIQMLLVCGRMYHMHMFLHGFIRLIEMLLVCFWENVSFACVLSGLYA